MILGIGIERIIKNRTNYFLPSKTTTLLYITSICNL